MVRQVPPRIHQRRLRTDAPASVAPFPSKLFCLRWPPAILSNASPSPLAAFPLLSGTAAFVAALHLSALLQHHVGISTGSPAPLPALAGAASVAVASVAAHAASVATERRRPTAAAGRVRPPVPLPAVLDSPAHLVRVAALGLLSYRFVLGGRFSSVPPSSYTALGSFARICVPATDAYATQSQRDLVARIGRKYGCHTCGTREIFRRAAAGAAFHCDHMPPRAVARQMTERPSLVRRITKRAVQFQFYPQCVRCSNRQGAILSSAVAKASSVLGKGKSLLGRSVNLRAAGGRPGVSYVHLRPRPEHLAGTLVAAVSALGGAGSGGDGDPLIRCKRRLKEVQAWGECTGRRYWGKFTRFTEGI